jgi:hypothetical protein
MLITQVGEQLRQRVPEKLTAYGLVHVRGHTPAAGALPGCLDDLRFEAD